VRRITDHLRAQGEPSFEAEVISPEPEDSGDDEYDELYDEAVAFVCERGGASTSAVQRQFRIGYNRAARMIEQMERDGIISEQNGSKKRRILRNIHDD
jgi:S-DNA-T family DNA segregation ATPase FtsK/SpoIIIE